MAEDVELLSELGPGGRGVVTRLLGRGPLQRRLQDLGVRRGASVSVVKYAPLRDPIEVKVQGINISLRLAEAALVEVRRDAATP